MSFCTCVATSLRSRSSLPPRCAFRFAHSLVVCATSTKPPFLQGLMALTTAQLECWEHADAEAKLRPRTSFHWPSPFYETGNTRCEGRHHRSTSWMHQLHGGMRLVALVPPYVATYHGSKWWTYEAPKWISGTVEMTNPWSLWQIFEPLPSSWNKLVPFCTKKCSCGLSLMVQIIPSRERAREWLSPSIGEKFWIEWQLEDSWKENFAPIIAYHCLSYSNNM